MAAQLSFARARTTFVYGQYTQNAPFSSGVEGAGLSLVDSCAFADEPPLSLGNEIREANFYDTAPPHRSIILNDLREFEWREPFLPALDVPVDTSVPVELWSFGDTRTPRFMARILDINKQHHFQILGADPADFGRLPQTVRSRPTVDDLINCEAVFNEWTLEYYMSSHGIHDVQGDRRRFVRARGEAALAFLKGMCSSECILFNLPEDLVYMIFNRLGRVEQARLEEFEIDVRVLDAANKRRRSKTVIQQPGTPADQARHVRLCISEDLDKSHYKTYNPLNVAIKAFHSAEHRAPVPADPQPWFESYPVYATLSFYLNLRRVARWILTGGGRYKAGAMDERIRLQAERNEKDRREELQTASESLLEFQARQDPGGPVAFGLAFEREKAERLKAAALPKTKKKKRKSSDDERAARAAKRGAQ